MIQLVNLKRQIESIRPDLDEAYSRVIESGQFIGGREVESFEQEYASLNRASHAIGCTNGTAALYLALEALGVGPGDEVITSTHTFFATAEAIVKIGAKPVFVDTGPDSPNIDLDQIESAISRKTKAIIPVHLYGHPVDMPRLMGMAASRKIYVIEDCSQAHMAMVDGKPVGTFGDVGAFSLFPAKNLGALGDGGVLVTNDGRTAERLRKLRDHGRQDKYRHDIVGFNFRLDSLQAAFLRAKLKYLPGWIDRRKQVARSYIEFFQSKAPERLQMFFDPKGMESSYHMFVIRVAERDRVLSQLHKYGVMAGVHYPIPCHLQPAFSDYGWSRGDFPRAERLAETVLSLPICGAITDIEVLSVAESVLSSLKEV